MKYREKIFSAFEQVGSITDDESPTRDKDIYTNADPFDFYRLEEKGKGYLPKTQMGLRKAFTEDLVDIELYLQMATSVRPLSDEAQDLDEITRLFSQQKLSARPSVDSVKILRHMISDENPEIALYAAEGLNSIEKSFIIKFQRVKMKIEAGEGVQYLNYFNLGRLYVEFAKIIAGQDLIQRFYLMESIACLEKANELKQNNLRIKSILGEAYMLINRIELAVKLFLEVIKEKKDDVESLMKLAECFYRVRDFENLRGILNRAAIYALKLDENAKLIVYQWIM